MYTNFQQQNKQKSLHVIHSQPTFHHCDVQKIINGLYLGDQLVANNKNLLQDLNIKHIVVVGLELKVLYPEHFSYFSIPVRDHRKENILGYFQKSNQFIAKALEINQSVFVHCAKGISRSATIIIAFLMYKYKMKRQEAVNFVRRKRRQISPNQGFMMQLAKYEEMLKNNSSK